MSEQEDYSIFKPHLDSHTNLGDYAVEAIEENNVSEYDTRNLAEEIASKSDLEKSYIRALLTDGSDYLVADTEKLTYEARPEGSGGNDTFYWRVVNQ